MSEKALLFQAVILCAYNNLTIIPLTNILLRNKVSFCWKVSFQKRFYCFFFFFLKLVRFVVTLISGENEFQSHGLVNLLNFQHCKLQFH